MCSKNSAHIRPKSGWHETRNQYQGVIRYVCQLEEAAGDQPTGSASLVKSLDEMVGDVFDGRLGEFWVKDGRLGRKDKILSNRSDEPCAKRTSNDGRRTSRDGISSYECFTLSVKVLRYL